MKNALLRTLALVAIGSLYLGGCSSGPAQARHSYSIYGDRAATYAQKMVGTRYRFGGNRPEKGFDCSGLVQYSYRLAGMKVPRNTRYQYKSTRQVAPNHLRRGDLLFFNQEGKRLSHVGIYIGSNRFVHAPSTGKRVRVSSLKNRYWRNSLASTRRFAAY